MERLIKALVPMFFLFMALALYTMGMAVESVLVIGLGVLFEGAFWLKLYKSKKALT